MMESDKDQFDSLIKLADLKRSVREGRRSHEWTFTALAYGALGALSVVPANIPLCLVVIAALLLWLAHAVWVLWNMTRNEADREQMYFYTDKAESLLPEEMRYKNNQSEKSRKPRSFCEQPAVWLQVATAFGLGIFSVLARYFVAK